MFFAERRRRTGSRLEFLRTRQGGTLETGRRPGFWSGYWPKIGALVGSGVLATIFLTLGGPSFPHRLGEKVDRSIRLIETIQIEDATETRNKREQAARRARPVFQNDPRPIDDLLDRLRELAQVVAQASAASDLPRDVSAYWNLNPDDPKDRERFQKLKKHLATPQDVDRLIAACQEALTPMKHFGLLDRIPPEAERDEPTIEVRLDDKAGAPFLPRREQVLIDSLIRDDGWLAKWLRTKFEDPGGGFEDPELAVLLRQLIAPKLKPTLRFNAKVSEEYVREAEAKIEPARDEYKQDSLVVEAGRTLGENELRLLRQEHDVLRAKETWTSWDFHKRWLGMATLVAGVLAAMAAYLWSTAERDQWLLTRRVFALCGLFVVTIGLARLFHLDPYRAQIIPLTLAVLYVVVAHGRAGAIVFGLGVSLLIAASDPHPFEQFVVLAAGTTTGVMLLGSVRSRTKLILVGTAAGAAYAAAQLGVGLLMDQTMSLVVWDALRSFACGLIAGFLMSGSLPFVESLFGVVTEISLIELADTSHPLLQDLVRRAPGTYNHSVTVSIIGEAAANAIGANALVVRVGALFHDVGKMLKPHYFIENKGADAANRHEQLAPAISTLIIIGHVKDGVDLARQHHLPQVIIDMIEQHHGTTLVDYFFHEATRELQGRAGADEDVEESAFRYPGPKPQTKEAAVMMLTDCVESASRALSDPTPARIDKLVHNLALNRLLDGQFDECGITLEELGRVEQSLKKSLTAVYHGRIKYPTAV